jgi:Zn-dependent peptidase ImmA (M78 family)
VLKLLRDASIDLEQINITKKNNGLIDVHKIAESLSIKIVPHQFSDGISGVFYKKGKELFLGVHSEDFPTRQRFTIAHEIGHYTLHADDLLHFDKNVEQMFFRTEFLSSIEEREANIFAAEILMPELLVEKCMQRNIDSVEEMAEYFKVSTLAMNYRLINLGIL